MKKTFTLCLILLFVFIFCAGSIGYVDIEKVFNEYKGIEDINKQIDKEMKEWKNQMTKMEKEINRLEQEFEEEAPMLSEEAKIRKRDEINKKRKQLNDFIEEIWGENGKSTTINQQLLKPIVAKINEVIKTIAIDDKYDAIFDISGGNLLYVNTEKDLTQMVIEELNKEFFIPIQTLKQYIVYDFIAEDKEARNEQYHIKLATVLYRNLNITNVFESVNIRDVNDLLQSRGITNIEDLSIANAMDYAAELGAEYCIMGTVAVSGSRIIVNITVLDVIKRRLLKDINKEASGDLAFENMSSEILVEVKKLLNE